MGCRRGAANGEDHRCSQRPRNSQRPRKSLRRRRSRRRHPPRPVPVAATPPIAPQVRARWFRVKGGWMGRSPLRASTPPPRAGTGAAQAEAPAAVVAGWRAAPATLARVLRARRRAARRRMGARREGEHWTRRPRSSRRPANQRRRSRAPPAPRAPGGGEDAVGRLRRRRRRARGAR